MAKLPPIFTQREAYSVQRLEELRSEIAKFEITSEFSEFTIFAAGSYARHEASQHSDVDLFFFSNEIRDPEKKPRTKELQLFGRLIEVGRKLSYPGFSNDCEYLTVLHAPDMFLHLGSPKDDHGNYFTLRMLMLLESKCLFGDDTYQQIVRSIVNKYFVDYPNHEANFRPLFLLNDISRFWKTLTLNYENKRGHSFDADGKRIELTEKQRLDQKVRNLKLKFSRMTTCFATIASLGSHIDPMTEEQVVELTGLTPRERLQTVQQRFKEAEGPVDEILVRYEWFLDKTALTKEQLHDEMRNMENRTAMFQRAEEYGRCFFELLKVLDAVRGDEHGSLLRYLVI
jgi:predicted nucleotidyltransferase